MYYLNYGYRSWLRERETGVRGIGFGLLGLGVVSVAKVQEKRVRGEVSELRMKLEWSAAS